MEGYFQGEGQEKILLCKGGGHYMKNKNIGGVLCQLNQISKKGPHAKMRKKKNPKNYQTLKKFPRSFRSLSILQFHISGEASRHAPVQYATYVVVVFSFY